MLIFLREIFGETLDIAQDRILARSKGLYSTSGKQIQIMKHKGINKNIFLGKLQRSDHVCHPRRFWKCHHCRLRYYQYLCIFQEIQFSILSPTVLCKHIAHTAITRMKRSFKRMTDEHTININLVVFFLAVSSKYTYTKRSTFTSKCQTQNENICIKLWFK